MWENDHYTVEKQKASKPPLLLVASLCCHPEQASFAQRGIWANRAKRRVLCGAIIARLARFLIN
jgi:hypothetical protein